MSFVETLELHSNPANSVAEWTSTRKHPLQNDAEYKVYRLEYAQPLLRNQVETVGDKIRKATAVSPVVNLQFQYGGFLGQKKAEKWPAASSEDTFKGNPQGTQMAHVDNTEPGDQRRWNYFANRGPQGAQTIVMDRKILLEDRYYPRFADLVNQIRERFADVDPSSLISSTPIHMGYFQQFMAGDLDPRSSAEAAYWWLEIATKWYSGHNFLKKELDALYADILQCEPERSLAKDWQKPGGLIFDNTAVLHVRYCPDSETMPTEEAGNVIRLWLEQKMPNPIAQRFTSEMRRDQKGVAQHWVVE